MKMSEVTKILTIQNCLTPENDKKLMSNSISKWSHDMDLFPYTLFDMLVIHTQSTEENICFQNLRHNIQEICRWLENFKHLDS